MSRRQVSAGADVRSFADERLKLGREATHYSTKINGSYRVLSPESGQAASHPDSAISGASAGSRKRHVGFAPVQKNSCLSATDPEMVVAQVYPEGPLPVTLLRVCDAERN